MNYIGYYSVDVVNGKGTRCTLFVSGCPHHCKGCFQQHSWPYDAGFVFTQKVEDKILQDLTDSRIKRAGLTLLGGEPLAPQNIPTILKLVQRVRKESPTSNIWCWTGYTLENLTIEQQEVVDLLDVLIDGKYVEELRDLSLEWRGSSNQRVCYLSQYAQENYDPIQR